jgi:hypothetical protein
MTASISTFTKIAIRNAGDPTTAGQLLDYASGNVGVKQQIIDGTGNQGTLNRNTNRFRVTQLPVEPNLSFQPTAKEWEYLFPWLYGATAMGSPLIYNPSDSMPLKDIQLLEKRSTDFTHNLKNVAVDEWTITSRANSILNLQIKGVGDQYENTTAFDSTLANLDLTTKPFSYPDLTAEVDPPDAFMGEFKINGIDQECFSAAISCSHGLNRKRFVHSIAAKGLRKLKREVTIRLEMPAENAESVYNSNLACLTGVPVFLRFRNPCTQYYIEFDFPNVIFPRVDIKIPNRNEIKPMVQGIATIATASASPLTIRLVNTP